MSRHHDNIGATDDEVIDSLRDDLSFYARELKLAIGRAEAAESRATAAEERLAEVMGALEDLSREYATLRANAKHMTTWNGSRDWFRVHPTSPAEERASRALAPPATPATTTTSEEG